MKLHWGAVYHASWGTFDARIGGGIGAFGESVKPHFALGLGYGVRSVLSRYSRRGYCDARPAPRSVALASVLRLVVNYRKAFEGQGNEWLLGVELSPTFLLPPYDCGRFLGRAPG